MAENTQDWGVLNTKVEFQGQQINKLADDTARQFVDFRETTQTQLSSLRAENREQFATLNRSIETLVGGLQQNDREKDREKRSNWIALLGTGVTAVAVATGILGTLATLRLTPIENDQKSTIEAIKSIVGTIDKISTKLDSFETRAEINDRTKTVDDRLNEAAAQRKELDASKVSKTELSYITSERNAQIARLTSDIAAVVEVNKVQAADIVALKIDNAKLAAVQDARKDTITRINMDIEKRATAEALEGVRLRLNDQRDRINLVSSRLQSIFEKNFATPRDPCLDSGAGCQPKTVPKE